VPARAWPARISPRSARLERTVPKGLFQYRTAAPRALSRLTSVTRRHSAGGAVSGMTSDPALTRSAPPPPRRQARAASPAARARHASSASGRPFCRTALPKPEPLRLRRQRIEHAAGQAAAPTRLVLPLLHDFPDPGKYHRFPCSILGHVNSP
jgi:hypothetical protein